MGIQKAYITPVIGQTSIIHPILGYSEVLLLMRDGKFFTETTDTPVGRKFKHTPSESKAEFDEEIPFEAAGDVGPADPVPPLEPIYVEVKTL